MKRINDSQASAQETVTISWAEYEQFQPQSGCIAELEQRVSVLMEPLRLDRHKWFGASSENISEDAMEQLSFLFNEAEVCAEEEVEESVTSVTAYKRRKKHQFTLDSFPAGTPTEVVEHRLEGEDLVCPECGKTI